MKNKCLWLLLLPIQILAQTTFTRVTDPNNPVVSFPNTAGPYKGAAWIDLDHNHLPDLFVSQKFLFRNLGNGQFEQLADVAGVTTGQAASGSSWADINNDQHPDCISASVVSGLHYNNGDQTFTLQNSRLPDFASYRAWDCALADADNNGLIDLFFAHADNFPPGSVQQPCKLYLQVAIDSFQLVTGYEFSEQFKPYTIPVWTDYDLDGDMDLWIGSGPGGAPGPDFCYKNLLKETGAFALERLTVFPFNVQQDGQVYNAVDVDNDGDKDICLTNYAGAKTRFYKNEPGGYVETSTPFTIQGPLLTNAWGDLDNDGDLDVLISFDTDKELYWYQNNDGLFAPGASLGAADNGICGIALADYDNDGDLDVYTNGATTARALFQNAAPANHHWIQCTLEGVQSNRSAIGAHIRVKTNVNGHAVWQMREVLAHNSFQSQHDLRQHFGLGSATTIDSMEVRWPSGLVQQFSNLAADNFLQLVEGQPIAVVVAAKSPENTTFQVRPNPVSRQFEVIAPDKVKLLQLFDTSGRSAAIQYSTTGNKIQVQILGNPAAGNYFLKAVFENGKTGVEAVIKL